MFDFACLMEDQHCLLASGVSETSQFSLHHIFDLPITRILSSIYDVSLSHVSGHAP